MTFLLLVSLARGATLDRYAQGIAALDGGNYTEARTALHDALDTGAYSADVYHALGNAYYREGELGRAIAAYERGLALEPRNADLLANLGHARETTTDRLDAPAETTPFFWQHSLSTRESGLLASSLLTLALALTLVHRLFRRAQRESPSFLRPLGWASLGLAFLFGASTAIALERAKRAIVIEESVTARSTLGPAAVDLFVLHEGAEVSLFDENADMTLVGLPDERKGWVPTSGLVVTDPAAPFPPPRTDGPRTDGPRTDGPR